MGTVRVRLGTALASALIIIGCASSKPPESAPPARPAVSTVKWLPIGGVSLSPGPWILDTAWGEVRMDVVGSRWLWEPTNQRFRPSTPQTPAFLIRKVMFDSTAGIVVIDRQRRIWVTRSALGPWKQPGSLPEGASLVFLYRGALSAITPQGPFYHRLDSSGWHAVPPFGDRMPIDARVGAKGVGLGIFVPQVVAFTKDEGKTWQKIDDSSVLATQIRHDGKDLLLLPGGITDTFPRRWNGPGGGLQRTIEPSSKSPTVEARRVSSSPERLESMSHLSEYHYIAMGDGRITVVRASRAPNHAGTLLQVGQGPLGGGVTWSPLPWQPNERSQPKSGETWAPVAVCDGRTAFTHGRQLGVVSAGKLDRAVNLPFVPTALAFSGRDRLLITGWGPRKSGPRVAVVSLGDSVSVKEIAVVPGKPTRNLSIHASCANPARVWLLDAESRLGWIVRENRLDRRILPAGVFLLRPLGLDPQGNLVLLDHDRSALLRLAEDGYQLEPLPFSTAETDTTVPRYALPSLEHGRGVMLDAERRLYETGDAGKTWRPVAVPMPLPSIGLVACDTTGCQFDSVLFREGWGAPRSGRRRPAKRKAKSPPPPIPTLRCAVRGKVDGVAHGTVGAIAPGVGGAPWMAAENNEEQGYTLRLGRDDGTVATRQLGTRRDVSVLLGASILGVQYDKSREQKKVRDPNPLEIEWLSSPDGDLMRKSLPRIDGALKSLVIQSLGADGGDAYLARSQAKLVLVRTDGTVAHRDWPLGIMPLMEWSGAIVEEGNRWFAVLATRPQGSQGQPLGMLLTLEPDGTYVSRTLALESPFTRYRGLALAKDARGVKLWSVERSASGKERLGIRRVKNDLRLGEVNVAAGSEDMLRGHTPFPACQPRGQGTPLRLARNGDVRVRLGEEEFDAEETWYLRVTDRGVCDDGRAYAIKRDESCRLGLRAWTDRDDLVVAPGQRAAGVWLDGCDLVRVQCEMAD